MDASDTLKKKKAQTVYTDIKTQLVNAQPAADCGSSACTRYSTCKLTFTSYEERRLFFEGRNIVNGCACGQ